ncbi:hypothetical protein D1643_11460, partial [Enterorhabdus sp. P55]|nr:hypothetical protein [Enterorhabdus sp. P55]
MQLITRICKVFFVFQTIRITLCVCTHNMIFHHLFTFFHAFVCTFLLALRVWNSISMFVFTESHISSESPFTVTITKKVSTSIACKIFIMTRIVVIGFVNHA